MNETLSLESVLHANEAAAQAALIAVGGVVVPELSLTVDVPGVGALRRHFAYLGNVVATPHLREPIVRRRIMSLLDSPDNERVLNKLESNRLDYMPLNKRAASKLASDLHRVGLHLPWAFRPMNFDFGARLEEFSDSQPLRFHVFYSQGIDIDAAQVVVKRVFSLPVKGSAHGTFQEPIFDEMLDEDVGLFMEANHRL